MYSVGACYLPLVSQQPECHSSQCEHMKQVTPPKPPGSLSIRGDAPPAWNSLPNYPTFLCSASSLCLRTPFSGSPLPPPPPAKRPLLSWAGYLLPIVPLLPGLPSLTALITLDFNCVSSTGQRAPRRLDFQDLLWVGMFVK